MSPEQLTCYLTDLTTAADVVEAIDDRDLQRRRGWDLSRWRYDLVTRRPGIISARRRIN